MMKTVIPYDSLVIYYMSRHANRYKINLSFPMGALEEWEIDMLCESPYLPSLPYQLLLLLLLWCP